MALSPRDTVPADQFLVPDQKGQLLLQQAMDTCAERMRFFQDETGEVLSFRLGKPQKWKGEFNSLVWDRPLYRVFVAPVKGVCLEIPRKDASLETALDALYQFMRDIGRDQEGTPWCGTLSGSHVRRLQNAALAALGDLKMEVPAATQEQLKNFVLQYCDGHIWTDRGLRPDEVQMVFPILMFMRDPPELLTAVDSICPHPGDKPKAPEPPGKKKRLEMPEGPGTFKEVLPDPERVRKLQQDIDWQVCAPERLDEYTSLMRERNEEAKAAHLVRVKEWQEECQEVRVLQEEADKAHQEALAAFEAVDHEAPLRAWELVNEQRKVVHGTALAHYLRDLGCIWEHVSQAGPLACSGKPMFFSCHLMSRADSDRAFKAIKKEQERRKEMTI